jgi:hypothetical protein
MQEESPDGVIIGVSKNFKSHVEIQKCRILPAGVLGVPPIFFNFPHDWVIQGVDYLNALFYLIAQ